MAGSTFQPPINLDPNQDHSQQTAFINQNFQSLAAALETNSFRIVGEGTTTVPLLTLASAGVLNTYSATASSPDINHNLGYVPAVLAYITDSSGKTLYQQLPFTGWSLGGGSPTTGGGIAISNHAVTITTSLLYVSAFAMAYGAYNWTGVTFSSQTIKYFLLQETASV